MKNYTINENSNNQTNVQNIIASMKAEQACQLGVAKVTLPDGTELPFYCNGEEDRKLAIKFTTICWEATKDTNKCMNLMISCFRLLAEGISPDEVINDYPEELYIDYQNGVVVNKYAKTLVSLDKEEKKLFRSKPQQKHLLLEKLKRYFEEEYEEDGEDDDE